MSKCSSCPHYREDTRTCGTPIIGEKVVHNEKEYRLCGCHMPTKTRLKGMSCPLGKWGASLTQLELSQLMEILEDVKSGSISSSQNRDMTHLWNKLTGDNRGVTRCRSCVNQMIDELNAHFRETGDIDSIKPN